jgi:hypothetical protein
MKMVKKVKKSFSQLYELRFITEEPLFGRSTNWMSIFLQTIIAKIL